MPPRTGLLVFLALCLAFPVLAEAQRGAASERAATGDVWVYLQPAPANTSFTFSIDTVTLGDAAGVTAALDVTLDTVRPTDARRQRLLATGRVPSATYSTLSLTIKKATRKVERSDVALDVPDVPIRIDVPVVVTSSRASVLWIEFRPGDSVTGTAFAPVFLPLTPARPLASLTGFVSNAQSNAITVFDKRTRMVTGAIPLDGAPSGMALDRQAGRLYVACPRTSTIVVIDVAAGEIIEEARVFPGDDPEELALTPDGRTLLSVNRGSRSVTFFDTAPLSRGDRVTVGNGPSAIAIDPSGRRAFVFESLSDSISVIDIARRTVTATITTEASPLRGAFSPTGERLYVIHDRSPYLSVIDAAQSSVVSRARLHAGLGAIKVDPRRNLLYVGGRDDTSVESYDPTTLLPLDAVRVRGGVAHLAIDVEDNILYVVSPGTRSLVAYSLADRKVVADIDIGRGAYWVATMGER